MNETLAPSSTAGGNFHRARNKKATGGTRLIIIGS